MSNMEATSDTLSELDKFKRRLIRSVARLLIKENKPEDEVFKQMQEETGCNCKVLWDRMRMLTVKKLHRLLKADDKSEHIAAVGRMSLTDWLLFDLVIVHEDFDVIGKDIMMETKKDKKPLLDLFVLVQQYNIESRTSDSLAEAWTAATIHYNTKGHQCSPMLMQRRWYQLKQFTRELFYNYWYSFRGAIQRLPEADKWRPTKLQRTIAQRFPSIILKPFMTWDEMIKDDLVIMPEVFEEKMRRKTLPKPLDESSADVIIVEPDVETIDLGDDSDSEPQEESTVRDTLDSVEKVKIKTEIEVEDENLVQYPLNRQDHILKREKEVIASIDNAELALDNETFQHNVSSDIKSLAITNMQKQIAHSSNKDILHENISAADIQNSGQSSENFPNVSEQDIVKMPQITNIIGNVDISNISHEPSSFNFESGPVEKENEIEIETIDLEDDVERINSNCQPTTKEHISNSLDINHVIENIKNFNRNSQSQTLHKPLLNIQYKKAIEKSIQELKESFNVNAEVNEIENEIAKKANDYINRKTNVGNNVTESCDLDRELSEKADSLLKSRTEKKGDDEIRITDLDFSDDGVEFIDDGIEIEDYEKSTISDTDNIDLPVEKSEENCDELENADTGKFDLKLLMDPVVCTLKLDDMKILINKSIQSVRSDYLIKEIEAASKIYKPEPSNLHQIKDEPRVDDDKEIEDDIFDHDLIKDLEEPVIRDNERIKLTSYLLNKPRVCDYNFIKLCKNPDFNTRLKRLNVGFFGSTRNRELLKACKPLTIDVSKAFEEKLIDGTMYLKDVVVHKEELYNDSDKIPTNVNIRTSTKMMQSLFDGLVSNMLNNDSSHKDLNVPVERNTVINLPNINEVRRINQKLLTAEVSPIQISANINKDTVATNYQTSHTDTQQSLMLEVLPMKINNDYNAAMENRNYNDDLRDAELGKLLSDDTLPEQKSANMNEHMTVSKSANDISNNELHKLLLAEVSSTNASFDRDITKCDDVNLSNGAVTNNVSNPIGDRQSHKPRSKRNELHKKRMESFTTKLLTTKRPIKHPVVPWLKRCFIDTSQFKDETLLTLDALNKMIDVMDGIPIQPAGSKKAKTSSKIITIHEDRCDEKRKTKTTSNKVADTEATDIPVSNTETKDADNNTSPNKVTAKINIVFGPDSAIPRRPKTKKLTRRKNSSKLEKAKINNEIKCTKEVTCSEEDVIFLNENDIASNEVCGGQESESLINVNHEQILSPPINDVVQSSVSETVNHILVEPVNEPVQHTTTCDASTTTVEPEVDLTPQSIPSNTFFTVLPTNTPNITRNNKDITQQQKYFAKVNVSEAMTCSCQLPVVNSTQKHLVLDGSSFCAVHGPQNLTDTETTSITQNVFQRIMSQSTCKLAKDTLLLSTVTFANTNMIKDVTNLTSKILGSSFLPPGIELVLAPTGEITYLVQPDVVLDQHQLKYLNSVVEAVKVQLRSKPTSISAQPLAISNEVVDLTDEDKTHTQNLSNNIEEKISEDIAVANNLTATDLSHNEVTCSEDNISQNNVEHHRKDKTIGLNMNDINIKNGQSQLVNKVSESSTSLEVTSASNTILQEQIVLNNAEAYLSSTSQLSSIENVVSNSKNNEASENNLNVPAEDVSISNRKSILSDLMEISGIGAEDIAPLPEEVPPQFTSVNPLVITLNSDNTKVAPITSFKELRYAFENNATFFELNCVTGIIKKVNISISKTVKSFQGNVTTPLIEKQTLNPVSIVPRALKSTKKPIIIRKLSKLQPLNFKGLNKVKTTILKPNLKTARKSLLKSNMELYEQRGPPVTVDITNDDSDSSDDEPLIKKAKRMREIRKDLNKSKEQATNEINDTNVKDNADQMEVDSVKNNESAPNNVPTEICPIQTVNMITSEDIQLEIEHPNQETTDTIPAGTSEIPVGDDLMMDEEFLESLPDDEFIEEGVSSSEECILGV